MAADGRTAPWDPLGRAPRKVLRAPKADGGKVTNKDGGRAGGVRRGAGRAVLAWSRQRRQVGGQGARLGPRGRHEPVRRLRPRPTRARVPEDPSSLLQAHADRARRQQLHQGAVGLGIGLGELQEGEEGLRQAPAPPPGLSLQALRLQRDPAARRPGQDRELRPKRHRRWRREDPDRRQGRLPRQAEGEGLGRGTAGDQPRRAPGIRQGGGPERGPLVVAQGGASSAGGRRALLRAGDERRRRLRCLRRHPQPGLRRQGFRDRAHEQGRHAHQRPGGALPQEGGDDVLLLHLGGPDGERRAWLPGRRARRLPEERPGPVRRSVALPQVDSALLAKRDRVEALGVLLRPAAQDQGAPARGLSPNRHRARRRLERELQGLRRRAPSRLGPAEHLGTLPEAIALGPGGASRPDTAGPGCRDRSGASRSRRSRRP